MSLSDTIKKALDQMAPSYVNLREHDDPDAMVDDLLANAQKAPAKIVTSGYGAWTVCFTKDHPQLGNILSMKVRRSTTEDDWFVLGRIAMRMGAPRDCMPATIEKDANATHYWIWGHDPSQQPIVDMMMGRGR